MHIQRVTLLLACSLFLLNSANGTGARTLSESRPPAKMVRPIKFTGEMVTGKTYRAVVVYHGDTGMWWPVGLRIPRHHGVHVNWKNISDYPRVKKQQQAGQRLIFTYTVLSKDIRKVPDRWQWRTSYECRIIGHAEAPKD